VVEYHHNPESSSDVEEEIILRGIGISVTFYERVYGGIAAGTGLPKRKPYSL